MMVIVFSYHSTENKIRLTFVTVATSSCQTSDHSMVKLQAKFDFCNLFKSKLWHRFMKRLIR